MLFAAPNRGLQILHSSILFVFSSQTILHATLDTAQSLCPEMCQKSHLWDHVIQNIPEKALLDQLLTVVYSKLTWVPGLTSPLFIQEYPNASLGWKEMLPPGCSLQNIKTLT